MIMLFYIVDFLFICTQTLLGGPDRYSGLRKDDFNDVVDSLTSQFSIEIGPARERESSQRHEAWVHAAGGAIRGLKTAKDGRPWVSERLQC